MYLLLNNKYSISQSREEASRLTHYQKIAGSNPASATNGSL